MRGSGTVALAPQEEHSQQFADQQIRLTILRNTVGQQLTEPPLTGRAIGTEANLLTFDLSEESDRAIGAWALADFRLTHRCKS